MNYINDERQWLLCPVCKNKTRLQVREDTELKNFPLFCPKCKQETLINVKQFNVSVIKEPDAKTQSRWFTVYETVITGSFYIKEKLTNAKVAIHKPYMTAVVILLEQRSGGLKSIIGDETRRYQRRYRRVHFSLS